MLQVRTGDDDGAAGENFTVLRLKRRMLRQSYVGALYTLRDRGAGAGTLQTVGADFQLATSGFRGSQNLIVGGFALVNPTRDRHREQRLVGCRVDYPNDRWNAGVSYRDVEEHFDPALGFTLRNGYQKYNPYLNFSPRPRTSHLIRRLGFTADVDLQTDRQNRFLTRVWNLTLFNVDFQTQDTFSVLVLPEYERLDRAFAIYPGVTLPKGREYSFVRYRVTAGTANRRLVAVVPTVEWGGFYSGTRQRAAPTSRCGRDRRHRLPVGGVEPRRLREGRFETRLFRVTPELQFNQWVSVVNTVQYDSVSRVLGWQSRFRWILKPGNDLYVVYTQNWLDDPVLDRLPTLNHRAASKVIYTQRF